MPLSSKKLIAKLVFALIAVLGIYIIWKIDPLKFPDINKQKAVGWSRRNGGGGVPTGTSDSYRTETPTAKMIADELYSYLDERLPVSLLFS
jgi:hypothetical protein